MRTFLTSLLAVVLTTAAVVDTYCQSPTTVAPVVSVFSGALTGTNEVPPAVTLGNGHFTAKYDPITTSLSVTGEFSGLTAAAAAAHVHQAAAGSNGGVVFELTATAATSGTITGSGPLTFDQQTALFAGGLYVNVHTSTFPGGEIRDQINFVVTVDGLANDPNYLPVAAKLNANAGFGLDIDVTEIVYYPDSDGQNLCMGIKSRVDVTNANGIGLWLNFDELTGSPAGTALGGSPGGHYMGGSGGTAFTADFEVDYMFAYNPGATLTSLHVDAVSLVGGRTADYLGDVMQDGVTRSNPGAALFSVGSMLMAYLNFGGDHGFEFCVPYAELGVTTLGYMEAFAFVVSSDAFFSDQTVPGDILDGSALSKVANLGFNADFANLGGGPFHSGQNPLPVELDVFEVTIDGSDALLTWHTAGEINNAGFWVEAQRSKVKGQSWKEFGFVNGHGTTPDGQAYTFRTQNLEPGTWNFRLRQVDFDGSFEYSPIVEAIVEMPERFVLEPVYPNPFNPQAVVQFGVRESQPVTLTLHDALGRLVKTLFEGAPSSGQVITARLDAADLTAGAYFVRLTGEGILSTRSAVLLR